MKIFRSISIKNKIIAIMVLVAVLSLGIGYIFVIANDVHHLKRELVNDVKRESLLIWESCKYSFETGDTVKTSQILKNLATIIPLEAITLYSSDSTIFTSFPANSEPNLKFGTIENKSNFFDEKELHVFQLLESENQKAGFIHVVSTTALLQLKIERYLFTTILFMVAVALFSFFIAKIMSSVISYPIITLAEICKDVGSRKDYTVRVENTNRDEIGQLSKEFNNMLEQIQLQEKSRDRAERELRENERFLQSIFDSIQDEMFVINDDWNVLQINTWMAQKYSKKTYILGNKCYRIFQNKESQCAWCPARDSMNDGKFHSATVAFTAKDKTLRWRNVSCFPHVNVNNKRRGVIVYIKDITDLKEVENELRNEKGKIEQVAQTVGTGISIISRDYCVVWANRVMKDTYGDVLGHPCCSKNEIHWETCPNCSVRKIFDQASEKVVQDQVRVSIIGEKVWNQVITTPIRDEAGNITAAMEVVVPISERKKMEQTLKESEVKYRSLFEACTDAIFVESLTGDIVDCNEAAGLMYRTKKHKLIGMNVQDLLTEDFVKRIPDIITVEKMYGGIEIQAKNRRMDGEIFPVDVSTKITRIHGEDLIIAYVRDVTAQKKAELEIQKLNAELEKRVRERTAQLAEANRELESFSYSVSHDLRAPLRAIGGYADILLKKYSDKLDTKGRENLEVIHEQVQWMNRLIKDLLNFSRMNRMDLKHEHIQFNKMVDEIVAKLKSHIANNRFVDFRIAQIPDGYGDQNLIHQVFTNLIANAIKFTKNNAHALIEVGHKKENEYHVYFVKDNGVGFNMKYADRLFGVFQRLHSVQQFEGTGVGLAIVERIIHRHGGKVWAEADVDKGATLYFSLPKNNYSASKTQKLEV